MNEDSTTAVHAAGPLSGVRVLDLTRVIMGPFGTQVLADQGADVILVEHRDGDTSRVMGPGPHPELSGIALNLLRNKRSIVLDLKSPSGRETARRLAATCDVVISTIRPQALQRLTLDYESVVRLRPDIVYCQAQGFALDGPRANEPAYDDIIQAATGVADVMQRALGQTALLPTIYADKVCGLIIAQAVTAALLNRERTGRGEHIEVAMEEAITSFMLVEHGSGAISEPPASYDGTSPSAGYARVLSPERRPHATKDGLVHLFPYRPEHYRALFIEAGVSGAETDDRYVDQRAALRNSDTLYQDIRAIAPRRTTSEWLDYCRGAGIPATAVASLQDLVDALPLEEHPVVGKYRVIPPMARFRTARERTIRRAAPLVGADTAEVLDEMAALDARGESLPDDLAMDRRRT
jgi:crotonobetainyl-CoA:carnitine CoA-transferase CaiB-like acyl-CoA transferase